MADIFLHQYNQSTEVTSAFNAAHKYRFAYKRHMDVSPYLTAWNRGKHSILTTLMNKIEERFDRSSQLAFAVAPSDTRPFVDDIESSFLSHFTNSINLSNCFSKINGFIAGNINEKLPYIELRKLISLDTECFNGKINGDIKTIILLDDVFAWGNTFNAMKIAINAINEEINFITVAILKTSSDL